MNLDIFLANILPKSVIINLEEREYNKIEFSLLSGTYDN
jgi:hypothetical protein